MNKEYIDVAVVPYALADTLLAFHNAGIKEIFITKEDDDIHIRIEKTIIERAVYKKLNVPAGCKCCEGVK